MQFQRAISFVFHPIIVPICSALLYFIFVPRHMPREWALRVLGLIFIATYLVPIFLLFFLKKLKMIENFHLPSINERKFPILFFIVLSFLLGRLLMKTHSINLLALSFYGCTLSLALVFTLFYFKIKTSLHALGFAGLIGFISFLSYAYQINLLGLLLLLFLLFGLVASSRLILKAHKPQEIYLGFLIGFFSQIVVYLSYNWSI